MVTNNELRIDDALLARAPVLRLVANATAGFDNMDIAAMRARGVWGSYSPDSFSADTANDAIGLLLAITRRLPEAIAMSAPAGGDRTAGCPAAAGMV